MASDAAVDRLVGALVASDAAEGVLRDALETMITARDILTYGGPRSEAVEALDRGIAKTRYALNLTDEPPS